MKRISFLLMALLFAGNVWSVGSQPPAPSELKSSQKPQQITHTNGDDSNSNKNGRAPIIPQSSPINPNTYPDNSKHQTLKDSSYDWWLVIFTGALAFIALIQAGLFLYQLLLMRSGIEDATTAAEASTISADAAKKSADVAELTMRVGGRAFVFAIRIMPFWEPHAANREYNWRFRPELKNTGATPTKNMIMHTQCELRDILRPVGFNFDYQTTEIWRGFIPPQNIVNGSLAPRVPNPAITPANIIDIQNGRKVLHFWGWIRYNDVFEGTQQHITRFSWILSPIGDPQAFIPNQQPESLIWNYFLTDDGNCADEECPQYNN